MPRPVVEFLKSYPFFDPYDAFYDAVYNHTGVVASATKLVLDAGNGNKMVVRGAFALDAGGKVVGGTMTGYDVYQGTVKVIHATGYDADAEDVAFILGNASGNYEAFKALFVADIKIVGTENADFLEAESGAAIFGKGGDDWLYGDEGGERLVGGKGDDLLNGEGGADVMTGGKGKDLFGLWGGESGALSLSAGSGGTFDVITDFSVKHDRIGLAQYEFDALATYGPLAAKHFKVGSQATTADQHILYNKKTGGLFYDEDGNGIKARVKIAELDDGLAMKASHFLVTDLL